MAQEPKQKKWNLSLGTSIGILNGEVNELVLPDFTTVNPYLSRLTWDLTSVPLLKFNVDFRYKRFMAGFTGGFALSSSSGYMNDFDWFYTNITEWTHWSRHSIFFNGNFLGDLNARFRIIDKKMWSFSLGAGIKVHYWDWRDKPHYGIYTSGVSTGDSYTPGVDNLQNVPMDFSSDQKGISYRVVFVMPYILVAGRFRYSALEITLKASYSPLVIADALDQHHQRSLNFNDKGIAGQYLCGDVDFRVYIYKGLFFSLNFKMEYLFEMRGNTDVYDNNMNFITRSYNSAGFQFFDWYAGVSLGYKF